MEDLEWGIGEGKRRTRNGEWRMKLERKLKMGNQFFSFHLLDLLFIMRIRYFHRYPRSRSKTFRGKIQRMKQIDGKEEVSFEEHVKSKDKYTSIFSRKIEGIVFLILSTFCNARETMHSQCILLKLKNPK